MNEADEQPRLYEGKGVGEYHGESQVVFIEFWLVLSLPSIGNRSSPRQIRIQTGLIQVTEVQLSGEPPQISRLERFPVVNSPTISVYKHLQTVKTVFIFV
jgi:hypothetical protein